MAAGTLCVGLKGRLHSTARVGHGGTARVERGLGLWHCDQPAVLIKPGPAVQAWATQEREDANSSNG